MAPSISKFFGLYAVIVLAALKSSEGFTAIHSERSTSTTSTTLFSESSRRAWLSSIAATAVVMGSSQQPAHASYSAYANREKDWENRKATGG